MILEHYTGDAPGCQWGIPRGRPAAVRRFAQAFAQRKITNVGKNYGGGNKNMIY